MERKNTKSSAGNVAGAATLLQQYAAYNHWANQRIIDAVNQLTQEQINQPITSSFPGIAATVSHIHDAENIWWQRLKLEEHVVRPSDHFTGTFAELQRQLLQQSALFEQWVNNASESQVQHVFAYMRGKEQIKMPVAHMLLHLFNHNSYHRGQIVTMLRQLGVDKIPSTDFNGFLLHRK